MADACSQRQSEVRLLEEQKTTLITKFLGEIDILNAKLVSVKTDDRAQPADITPPRPPQVSQSYLKSPICTKESPINTSNHTGCSTEKPLLVLVFGSSMARGLAKEISAIGNSL